MRSFFPSLLALLLLVLAQPASAGDAANLGLEYETVVKGRAPALSFTPAAPIKGLVVELVADAGPWAGKKQTLKSGPIGAGATKKLPFKQELGTIGYKASMHVTWGDGTKDTYTVEFSATRVGELKLDIQTEDVDLDQRKLQVRVTNAASAAELTIFDEDGDVIGTERVTFDPPAAPGTNLEVTWEEPTKKVLYMQLKVTDVAGFFVGVRITPFSISIPHEDVHFEFGSSAIRPTEDPKLQHTMGLVNEALKKHGTLLQLKLFVAGYTDTVGDKASNRALSLARAHAIAAWFRRAGLKIPVYYTGFGEEVLAKPTPDETEEQANRRAVYILSTHVPTGPDVPVNSWKQL
ncbi:MAG: OmpA family protein [Deltaproteobacteria bacterium]|nr:OmpA family protein [Deltaproteobacteria bacterium]